MQRVATAELGNSDAVRVDNGPGTEFEHQCSPLFVLLMVRFFKVETFADTVVYSVQ